MRAKPAATIAEYLKGLPEDRRQALETVRAVVNKSIPKGYRESLAFGMITWSVPLEVYPDTYNGQPLCYAALASQKNHMALYLMGAYADGPVQRKLVAGFKSAGKKLDMGKSCVRFKKLEDLPLDVIGEAAGALAMKDFIALTKKAHARRK